MPCSRSRGRWTAPSRWAATGCCARTRGRRGSWPGRTSSSRTSGTRRPWTSDGGGAPRSQTSQPDPGAIVARLGPAEEAVVRHLLRGPATADGLVGGTSMAGATILAVLTRLEEEGLVAGAFGRYRLAGALDGVRAIGGSRRPAGSTVTIVGFRPSHPLLASPTMIRDAVSTSSTSSRWWRPAGDAVARRRAALHEPAHAEPQAARLRRHVAATFIVPYAQIRFVEIPTTSPARAEGARPRGARPGGARARRGPAPARPRALTATAPSAAAPGSRRARPRTVGARAGSREPGARLPAP